MRKRRGECFEQGRVRLSGLKSVLITGTDTDVGKTLICRHLASAVQARNVNVITQKWVQTGCDGADDIRDHMLEPLPARGSMQGIDALRTPYRLKYPASPHMAAALEGVRIDIAAIEESHARLCRHFDLVLVEGSGGALVPLTGEILLADLAARLGMAAIVVIRNELGCINHALLTIEALRTRGIAVPGVIFNRMSEIGDEEILRENIRIISLIARTPVLGEMPFLTGDADGSVHGRTIGEAFYEVWRAGQR